MNYKSKIKFRILEKKQLKGLQKPQSTDWSNLHCDASSEFSILWFHTINAASLYLGLNLHDEIIPVYWLLWLALENQSSRQDIFRDSFFFVRWIGYFCEALSSRFLSCMSCVLSPFLELKNTMLCGSWKIKSDICWIMNACLLLLCNNFWTLWIVVWMFFNWLIVSNCFTLMFLKKL